MATSNVLVITIAGGAPVAVPADNAALAGQLLIDYQNTNPIAPEFAVSVRAGTSETPDA